MINIAKKENNYGVRYVCYKKISDKKFVESEKVLLDIIKNDSVSEVRKEALDKIKNQNVLIDIAKNNFYFEDDRLEAIKKITDQETLIHIVNYDKNYKIRKEAVKKITDEKILIELALKDPDGYIRKVAVNNPYLKDEKLLRKIMSSDTYRDEYPVYESIDSYELVKTITRYPVREAAAHKLEELGYKVEYNYPYIPRLN